MNAEVGHIAWAIGSPLFGGLILFLVQRYISRRDKAHEILTHNVEQNSAEIQQIKIRLARCRCADEKDRR